ncbi:MAG TPA: hypothetical protein VGR35_20485 [Tepidisphaeraceae bacterium]|nr:hypothetical protein [Tepidisphaeraceae bacterium]
MPDPIDYGTPDTGGAGTTKHLVWMRRGKIGLGIGIALWAASWIWFRNDPNVSRYPMGPVAVALLGIAVAVAGVVALMVGFILRVR